MDIKEALTRKIGPLPAWAYGGVIIGVVWAVYLWRKRQAATDAQPSLAEELGVGAGSFDLSGHLEDTGLDTVSGVGAGTGGESTVPTAKPANNEQWLAAALDYLASSFGYGRDETGEALYAYLQGKQLTAGQNVMIALARARYGPPPDGVRPPTPGGGGENPPGGGGGEQPPAAPQRAWAIDAPGGVSIWRDSIRVEWDGVAGVDGYRLYANGTKVSDFWPAPMTGKMIGNLAPNTEYTIVVSSVKNNVESGMSSPVTVRTKG